MFINKIVTDNVGRPGHTEFEPDAVNIAEGPNGAGKSLFLKSVRSCLSLPGKGQNYAGLLADDETLGATKLITADVTITRDLTQTGSPLTVVGRGFGELTGPKANKYVGDMFDATAINAEAFLIEDKKERLRLILEAIPFEIDAAGLAAIVPDASYNKEAHPLEIIEATYQKIYDQRTTINRDARQKKDAAKEIFDTQPHAVELELCNATIADLEQRLQMSEQGRTEAIEHSKIVHGKVVSNARAAKEDLCMGLRLRTEGEVSRLQREIEELRSGYREFEREQDVAFLAVRDSEQESLDNDRSKIDAECEDATRELRSELEGWRSRRDKEVTAQGARKIAARYETESEAFARESDGLTNTLAALNDFKANMLTELPIPGIELKDGDIWLDGKPWDKVQESRKCTLNIDLAIARSSASGILIIDALEKIDDDNFEIVTEHLQRCGRQCFVARANSRVPFGIRKLPALTEAAAPKAKAKGKKK